MDYIIFVISSAPDIYVELVCKDLGIIYFKSTSKLIFNKNNFLSDIVIEGEEKSIKLKYAKEFCRMMNLKLKESIIVGDGKNEELLFLNSDYSVIFKGSKLAPKVNIVIDNLEDLPKIIKNYNNKNN